MKEGRNMEKENNTKIKVKKQKNIMIHTYI